MIDRMQVEKILRINSVPTTASDKVIRSTLISANLHKEDVELALSLLKNSNTKTKETEDKTTRPRNALETEKRHSPEMIESLLGIKLDMTSKDLANLKHGKKTVSLWQMLYIIFLAILLSIVFVLTIMYKEQIGIFYSVT